MLKRWRILSIVCFLVLLLYSHSQGMDTDLYTVTGQEVPPNVLIILDNSSSMLTQDQSPDYNPSPPALPPLYPGSYPADAVYAKQGSDWVFFTNSIDTINCANAKTMLSTYGMWSGKLNSSDLSCGGKTVFLQTGNYLNYLAWTTTSNQPRLGLAKGTIHSYVNSTDGVRFGLMVFNANGQGRRVMAPVSDNKQTLFNALNDIAPPTVVDWTPLAETLYEAMLYFKGGSSYYTPGTTHTSPIQYRCQKNYVILITDGVPTHDVAGDPASPITNPTPNYPRIGDYDGDGKDPGVYPESGSHYLDDVAKYIHVNDLAPTLTGRQNITVYTIGFNPSPSALDSTLLQSTATNGGGKYFYCHNAQSFKISFQMIIEEVLSKSTSFLAPTVPISQMEKTTSGDRMYLGMFKPTEKSFWKGNIKKFGIAKSNDVAKGVVIGDVVDQNGNLAVDSESSSIHDSAISYWSTGEDGSEVEKGGVGEILKNMTDLSQRKIYTYLGGAEKSLAHSSNAFTAANIFPSLLSLSTDDERNRLVNFLYGYDAYDENGNDNMSEKREWILGAFIHSRPLIVHYPSRTVIFAGANDGMLHAFDDRTGAELWAFIPPDQLPKLQNLTGNSVEFFVDGSPKVYLEVDSRNVVTRAILVCGERRGGNHYFALDITDPLNPIWLYELHPGLADYSELGQTWSTPLMTKIKYGDGDKWVYVIGGGYDTLQDNLPVPQDQYDTKGRAIYVVDVFTGARIWKISVAENSQMKYSIPSDIARVDTNGDGRIDRLYVGDTGGQIWRLDIGDPSPAHWTGKRIFDSNDPAPPSGTDRRKIFYPPDVSLEKDSGNYELLVFGTGDREHPKSTAVTDRLYTVKDRNPSRPLTEGDLVDVTMDLLQTPISSSEKETILYQLRNGGGWYILLNENPGEKCLSPTLIFYGISYYTTFAPTQGIVSDPCYVGEGTARLYALSYLNAAAVFNFDLANDIGGVKMLARSDRSVVIGTAIPSGAILAIIGGSNTTSYVGVGGGIFKAPLKNSKVIMPLYWRQKF